MEVGAVIGDIVAEICDPSWHPVGVLDDVVDLTWTDRLCDVGHGSLNTTASDHHRELVQIGSTILIRRDGNVVAAGLLNFGESSADRAVMKLAWDDPNRYLAERVAYADPAHIPEAQTVAYDNRAGQLSTIIYGYIMANCGPAARGERRIGIIGTDPHVGPYLTAAVQARFDNLLELCKKLALPSRMAFSIETVDRQHYLSIYQTADLSDRVVFSDVTRTLGSSDWTLTAPTATHLIAGGQGDGLAREFATVTTAESLAQSLVWHRRIEQFFDDKSAESTAQLVAEAGRELAGKGETLQAKFQPGNFTDWTYGTDYRLGDLVGCELRPGWVVAKPITEVTTTITASGSITVTPLAGDIQSTSGLRRDQPVKALQRNMSALQRNR